MSAIDSAMLQLRYQPIKAPRGNNNYAGTDKKDQKLFDVCQEFEAIFIKQMLNAMRKTVNKEGLLDGGMAEEIFEDMLYDEYAKKMGKTASFGLAETIYKQLTKG
ncbi:MAG: rod-binding protein [Spirochaetales bacterium]|nr:rod-binding protein [Spirochaetales bacterium]